MFKVFLLTTIIVIAPFIVSAAIIHVPADQTTIQAGIDAAVDGDTVLVADGTYTGDGNRDIDFEGKAITVASENGPETCIVDCQGTANDRHTGFNFHQGETNGSVVSGFTVQNGYVWQSGGGISCDASSPTITDCIILRNTCYGGWSDNWTAEGWGGGGIYVENSTAVITHCIVSSNSAGNVGDGGGIYCFNASPTINSCTISDNYSDWNGGGIAGRSSSLNIINCLITNNMGDNMGGGILCSLSSSRISNCTIAGNVNRFWGESGGIYIQTSDVVIVNCLLWNNASQVFFNNEGSVNVSYSSIQDGFPGIGNNFSNPLFVGGEPFDYRLSQDSPCIDSGTDTVETEIDIDGNPRIQGGAVDMGAYENPGWPSMTRAYVKMPAHTFSSGDSASCSVSVWNADNSMMSHYPLFVILDVFDNYYCAPSYTGFDYYDWTYYPGLTELTVLPEFTWPENVGSASGIVWYAFLMNPEMTELVGGVGVFDFGWSE
mgnify:CR=1 FL=1